MSTAGLPPGSLVHTGARKAERTVIAVMDYDAGQLREKPVVRPRDLGQFRHTPTVTWIRVIGLHEVEVVRELGEQFDLHPLVLEDILDTSQRPKLEDMGEYVFGVVKTLSYDAQAQEIDPDQVSLVLGPTYVISFEEKPSELFTPIAERIRGAQGRIRSLGPDYLAYRLLDAVVDGYFVVLEQVEDRLEVLEEDVARDPEPTVLQSIQQLKRMLVAVRRCVWPLREVIGALQRRESPLISESTGVFLRDLYDHTIQVIEAVETSRDVVSGLLDIYLSSVSNRLNEVMKVLTIIATVFMPLSFLAGVYGMNFETFPEIRWKYGYPAFWVVIITIAFLMLRHFRRKGWL